MISNVILSSSWPDSDDLAGVQLDAVHLGNEDGCNSLVQSSSIHVDGGADREHKTSDSLVNTQVLLQTAERDGQCTSTTGKTRGKEVILLYVLVEESNCLWSFCSWPGGCPQSSDPGLEDAQEEGERVFPDDNKVDAGQENRSVDDESNDHSDHVHAQLPAHHLQVLDWDDLTTDETGDTEGRVPNKNHRASVIFFIRQPKFCFT